MKKYIIIVFGILITSVITHATQPEFIRKETFSLSGNFPAHPDPAPCFADWDGDNIVDLVVGVYIGDGNSNTMRVQVYLNKGSNAAPDFQFAENLNADGGILDPYWY